MGPERETLSHAEVLGQWVGSFVDELVDRGLRDVCLCPGSRSTPLAVAFARHPDVKVWTHLDERSCAYFALGMAKAAPQQPVAILCSSGTAAVNFAPAVVEAYHARVPLIVLTADRPPELQDLGANQTIDQHRLYGPAVKWFSQLPLPEASPQMLRYVRTIARRALVTSQESPMGPVHLDFLFREPLMPAPFEYSPAPPAVAPTSERGLSADGDAWPLDDYERPLIVCGPSADVDPATLYALARRIGAPVLADALSGLRAVQHSPANLVARYDSFLRSAALVEHLAPDFILRLGDPPTSKPLATYLARHAAVRQVMVTPRTKWPDPDLTATDVIRGDPSAVCTALLRELGHGDPAREDGWLRRWQEADRRTDEAVASVLGEIDQVSEPGAVAELAAAVPTGSAVFAGNSMPVRDIDAFFATNGKQITLLGSRGASGIDGVVSTALGIAARHDAGPTVLVIGDLSFYHDMNGLLAARRHDLNATIVLINNDGGGIFSFLPQHEQSEDFETLFGTPHGLDLSHVAPLYGVGFLRVSTPGEYRDALNASLRSDGVQVIEVRTDREANLKLHQRIWDAVSKAVEPLVSQEVRSK